MTVYVVFACYDIDERYGPQEEFDSIHLNMESAEKRVQEIMDGFNINNDLKYARRIYLEDRDNGFGISPYFRPKISPYELAMPDNPVENKAKLT